MPSTYLHKRTSTSGAVPSTAQTTTGEIVINTTDGKAFLKRTKNAVDRIVEIGAASAMRGATWRGVSGLSPIESFEIDEQLFLFATGQSQALALLVKVPSGYVQGNQIRLRISVFTAAVANVFRLRTVSTLIRRGADAVTSTANQYTSTNTDQAISSPSNRYEEIIFDITNANGQINSLDVSAGDIIRIQLSRITPSGTDTTSEVKVIPSTTEIIFG